MCVFIVRPVKLWSRLPLELSVPAIQFGSISLTLLVTQSV